MFEGRANDPPLAHVEQQRLDPIASAPSPFLSRPAARRGLLRSTMRRQARHARHEFLQQLDALAGSSAFTCGEAGDVAARRARLATISGGCPIAVVTNRNGLGGLLRRQGRRRAARDDQVDFSLTNAAAIASKRSVRPSAER
jgi:hypothetical protein